MDDRSDDPGHRTFGYIAVFVGLAMIVGNLVGYLHGHKPDWMSIGVGTAGIVAGYILDTTKGPMTGARNGLQRFGTWPD